MMKRKRIFKRALLIFMILVLLIVPVGAAAMSTDLQQYAINAAEMSTDLQHCPIDAAVMPTGLQCPDAPPVSSISISFNLPRGWNTRTARVGVVVTDVYDVGIHRVQARVTQSGVWTDITDAMFVEMSDNGIVYVHVTDNAGGVVMRSVFVEAFDRVRPEIVRVSRSGRMLRIVASDDRSGVASIIVDGEEFFDLVDDTLEYRLDPRNTSNDTIWIQARDYAGNRSATFTFANPFFIDPDNREPAPQPGNSTVADPPAGNATTTTPPPSETATTSTPPPSDTAATTTPPPSDATATPSPHPAAPAVTPTDTAAENPAAASPNIAGVVAVGNTQFITIQTRDGAIFYLIIDGYRDEDNVYLVTEVTARDLLSFTRDEIDISEDGAGGLPAVVPDPDTSTLIDGGTLPSLDNQDNMIIINNNEQTGEDAENDYDNQAVADVDDVIAGAGDGERASPIPGWIVIALLALGAAFAGYMFFVVLPRRKAKEAYIDDDDEELEEDYEQSFEPVPDLSSFEGDMAAESDDENPFDIPDDDED